MIIATGCQGEPLAAVNKMATGAHPCINLTQGDTIIFSSKIIPGNEKRIFRLFNIFVQQKIEVITEKDHFIHVSGHPCVDELKKMYELTRPNVAIPVHGEPVHIHEHAKLAKRLGIKHSLEARNGSVINLSYNESHIINKVKSGYLTVDGTCLIPDNSDIFKFRRKMRDDGIAIISLVFDKHWELLTTPFLNFPGILSEVTDQEMIRSLKKNLAKNINSLTQGQRPTKDAIEKSVKLFIKKFLKKEIGKNPVILLNIENARS
jgi:ribonuclease J